MLELLDYRRNVAELYRKIRAAKDKAAACQEFRHARNALFRSHPQSALDDAQNAAFTGLRYYDYNPAYRVMAQIETHVEPEILEYDLDEDGHFQCRRFGEVHFT